MIRHSRVGGNPERAFDNFAVTGFPLIKGMTAALNGTAAVDGFYAAHGDEHGCRA